MASKKKEAEGIALLSMYNDEDMDPDEDDSENGDEVEDEFAQDKDSHRNIEPFDTRNEEKFNSDSAPETTPPLAQPPTPVLAADEATVKSPAPPTPQPQITVYSPAQPLPLQVLVSNPLDGPRARKLPLGIVDYAHDETAMSPEAEEGEILNSGLVTLGSEAQIATGNFPEKTPPGTVHVLTPNIQATPPQPLELPAEQQEQSKSDNSAIMNDTRTGLESTQMEVDVELSVEVEKENVDPLEKFLPPPPKIKCPEELQKKINKFLEYKKAGKSFNADLRNRKDYRNPDFLLHAVRYQDIDQIGTCFSKVVFDPHGYDKSDYYDEIEADMKREMERKEQERKKAQKVDFVSGGTQPGIIGPAPKISAQIPVATVSSVAAGLQSVPTAADAPRDGRQNKKTKWDKVDGDKRPLHSGGQEALSAASAHAALLTAANAGAGYTAFAQQKRREAEEKRSSEKKFQRS